MVTLLPPHPRPAEGCQENLRKTKILSLKKKEQETPRCQRLGRENESQKLFHNGGPNKRAKSSVTRPSQDEMIYHKKIQPPRN